MSWLEPTNLLLLACALIYGVIGEWVDGGILLMFVLGISLLDAVQQQRSNRNGIFHLGGAEHDSGLRQGVIQFIQSVCGGDIDAGDRFSLHDEPVHQSWR